MGSENTAPFNYDLPALAYQAAVAHYDSRYDSRLQQLSYLPPTAPSSHHPPATGPKIYPPIQFTPSRPVLTLQYHQQSPFILPDPLGVASFLELCQKARDEEEEEETSARQNTEPQTSFPCQNLDISPSNYNDHQRGYYSNQMPPPPAPMISSPQTTEDCVSGGVAKPEFDNGKAVQRGRPCLGDSVENDTAADVS
jgi:hypothetical protein